jgi:hypothetical protein
VVFTEHWEMQNVTWSDDGSVIKYRKWSYLLETEGPVVSLRGTGLRSRGNSNNDGSGNATVACAPQSPSYTPYPSPFPGSGSGYDANKRRSLAAEGSLFARTVAAAHRAVAGYFSSVDIDIAPSRQPDPMLNGRAECLTSGPISLPIKLSDPITAVNMPLLLFAANGINPDGETSLFTTHTAREVLFGYHDDQWSTYNEFYPNEV